MRGLASVRRNWEGLAREDPLWAVCSDPSRAGRRWDLAELLTTGHREINLVMARLESKGLLPSRMESALDFGSGVGRLTQAMTGYFSEVVGVDISETMAKRAREINQQGLRCRFVVNNRPDLSLFADESFDLVYSNITLQHMPPRLAKRYIAEFVRILRPGGVGVFQVVDHFAGSPWQHLLARGRFRIRARTRLRSWAKAPNGFAMDMRCVTERAVHNLLEPLPVTIVDSGWTNSAIDRFNGELEVTSSPGHAGHVSRLYAVSKVVPERP